MRFTLNSFMYIKKNGDMAGNICSFYFYKHFNFEKNAFNFFGFIKKNFFHCTKILKNSLVMKEITTRPEYKCLKNQTTIIKIKYFKRKETILNCKNLINLCNFQLLYFLTNFFIGFLYIKQAIFYIMFGVNLEYLQAIVFFLKNSHNILKQSVIFFNMLVFKKAFLLTPNTFNLTEKTHLLCSGKFFFLKNFFFLKTVQIILKKKNFHTYYQFIETYLKALKFFKIRFTIIQNIFAKIALGYKFDFFFIKNKKMYFNLFLFKIFQNKLSVMIFFFEKISRFFYYDKPIKVSVFFNFFFYLDYNLKISRYPKNIMFNYISLRISINKIIEKINNKLINITKYTNANKTFGQLFFNLDEFFENYTKKKSLNSLFVFKEKILNQTKKVFLFILIFKNSLKLISNNTMTMIRLFNHNFCQLNKFKKKPNKRFYNVVISRQRKEKRFHWVSCLKIQEIIFFFYKIITTFLNVRIVFCFSNFLNTTYKHTFKNLMSMKKIYNVCIFIFFKKKIKYFFISHNSLFLFDSMVYAIIYHSNIHFKVMHKLIYSQSIPQKRIMHIFFYVILIKTCLKLEKKYISYTNCPPITCLKNLVSINLHFFSLIVYFYFKKKKHINLLLLLRFFLIGFYNLISSLTKLLLYKKRKDYVRFFKFFCLNKTFKKFEQRFFCNFFFTKILNVCFSTTFELKQFSCKINSFFKIQACEKYSHIFFDKKKKSYLKKNPNDYIKLKNYIFLNVKRLFDFACV
nr:hypothetical protein CparaKRNrm2_p076 [Cryptomonas paramecium]